MNNEVGFNVADLKAVLQIINVVSSRGAIRANEMSAVGDLFDRISKFVESVEQAAQNNTSADSAEKGEVNG